MRLDTAALVGLAVLLALAGFAYWTWDHGPDGRQGFLETDAFVRMASPGALTREHAFLEHDCGACHEPVTGAADAKCVVCHANETELLGRQPTAFHADIGSCATCHLEHAGSEMLNGLMNHRALARIGLANLQTDDAADGESRLAAARLRSWLRHWTESGSSDLVNPRLSGDEIVLDCATCHRNADPHFELLGEQCSDCHDTQQWSLPEFRHPPATSRDCAQCHQAPPSHYMMHFSMISRTVAGRHDARIDQCFACHQTTSWTDIKRVGTYKHH